MPVMSKERLAELKDVLAYDPKSGKVLWRIMTRCHGGLRRPGDEAGSVRNDSGYVFIGYTFSDGVRGVYRAHRLAWLFMTGEMPHEIDHKNGNRSDNRWSNLRLATRTQNNMNHRALHSNNKSGHKGVSWRKDTEKWHARITINGRVILLGDFLEKQDAIAARRAAEVKHYGDYSSLLSHE